MKHIYFPKTAFKRKAKNIENIGILLENLRKNAKKGLHLGAGEKRIEPLINCDLFNPSADLKADAADLSMFNNEEVDYIESHHMIEHLPLETTKKAFKEWNRVLCKDGIVVLTFPDFTKIAQKWIKYSFLYRVLPKPARLDYLALMVVGDQIHDGMFHNNVFDHWRMKRLMGEYGFDFRLSYYRYPKRPTPSRIVIAQKIKSV